MNKVVRAAALSLVVLSATVFPRAQAEDVGGGSDYQQPLSAALRKINLTVSDLSLPKLGFPHSTPGRLQAVDRAMNSPLSLFATGSRISSLGQFEGTLAAYQTRLLAVLGYAELHEPGRVPGHKLDSLNISKLGLSDASEGRRLSALVDRLTEISRQYQAVHAGNGRAGNDAITAHIQRLVADASQQVENRRLSLDAYHRIGQEYSVAVEAGFLLASLEVIETFVDATRLHVETSVTWDTPLGRVRIAGTGNDTHSGHFFLLIDTGGDDRYTDVGSVPGQEGFSYIIDLKGNDEVVWQKSTGPGAGVFGIGVWVDSKGNDVYKGRNVGLGTGLFGAGALWDREGDDSYQSGSLSQGAGQYGIGILVDEHGDDRFTAELSSQAYGGTGGVGILINHTGNDVYRCGNVIPDQADKRALYHSGEHYLSMCQGYSFGRRKDISGGIGLLVDHDGDDVYEADIFAQGSSYWFGLGMLVDSAGNDSYSAYEHAQGEGLHLGAGFLGDYAGNDSYVAYEHAQGTGIDRSIGLLLDVGGDDSYLAKKEAQGVGIKPYGFGILLDAAGNDVYSSRIRSQGYSKTLPTRFPEQQWPVGVLLDLGGSNRFEQPYSKIIDSGGRVQNRQGIAFDYAKETQ